MGKLWKKIRHDCRGAVTVMVTLLLIPAVLISGTGVDLARLYTAKSIVQDGNQLAANAALTNYDALLQDLYGLYGMMTDDPAFADLMDQYIKVAVLGDGTVKKGLGTFQLFYGSNLSGGEVTPISNQNLANPEVLRRQIEEYAKFRAPVIIVEELMDLLDALDKVKADADVVKQKMDIDDKVKEIDEYYKAIRDCIENLGKKAKDVEEAAFFSVNNSIGKIEELIDDLYITRNNQYTEAKNSGDEEMAEDYYKKMEGIIKNIHSTVVGGEVAEAWYPGGIDENGEFQSGYWSPKSMSIVQGLNPSIENNTDVLEYFISNTSKENDCLDDLLKLCKSAEENKKELKKMLSNLEDSLNEKKCSEELATGLTQKDPDTGESILDSYRTLLKYDVYRMAVAMDNIDRPQIQKNVELLDGVYYGEDLPQRYSRDALADWSMGTFGIDQVYDEMRSPLPEGIDILAEVNDIIPDKFEVLGVFLEFQDSKFDDTHNNEFYQLLNSLYSSEKEKSTEGYEKNIKSLLGSIQDTIRNTFVYEPEGAYSFSNGKTAKPAEDKGTDKDTDTKKKADFGDKGDWSKDTGTIKNALSDDLLTRLRLEGDKTVDKILLLTYVSEMFSCYSTGKHGNAVTTDGEKLVTVEKNMNGIPLGIDVNYYYQSELEYIYHGDISSAKSNLQTVARTILLVRFVFNYVASFSVPFVQVTVSGIKAALAWTGPIGIAIGELARLALALGESAMDVGRLKSGATVALYKTEATWKFSPAGIATGAAEKDLNFEKDSSSDSTGFSYKDYVRLLLLLVDGDTMAQRTASLIEMNVTNKKNKIGDYEDRATREEKMTEANMFLMREAATDISVTTNVELKMIFLSMPFAQKGVNGVVPPGTLPLTVTDYRGY